MNQIVIDSFKQTFKSGPFVFKNVTIYFGIYFIGIFLIALFVLENFLSLLFLEEIIETTIGHITTVFNLLCHTFTGFIIPYYAYKYDNKGITIKSFWTFISETVWPVVLNHMKAFAIILLFFLLPFILLILISYFFDLLSQLETKASILFSLPLALPGIYKAIRFSFLTQTVFFDDIYKQGKKSALKTAQNTTKGYFWLIVLFFSLIAAFGLFGLISQRIFGILKLQTFPSQLVILSLWFLFNFYMYAFLGLLKTQFYFALKKHRMEAISL